MSDLTVADELARAGVKNVEPFRHLKMPFKLKDHQIRGLNQCLVKPRFGLFFEARTGKTIVFQLTAIYCAHYGVKTVLLMPPILFLQFLESWEEIEGDKPSVHVFRQPPKKRAQLLQKWKQEGAPDLLVMTKEIYKKHWADLVPLGYTALTYDESHQGLAKVTTDIFKTIERFLAVPNTRLILSTGTPIPSAIEGAYPPIQLLNPGAYADEAHFYRLHVEMGKITQTNRRGKEVLIDVPVGYKNIGILHAHLYKNAMRAVRQEVLDVKTPNVQVVPFALSPAHQRLYKTLMRQRVLEIGERIIPAIQSQKLRMLALRLISSPHRYSEEKIKNEPLAGLEQLLHSCGADAGEKVLVFANFNESVETVTETLAGKYGAKSLYGKNSASQNQKNVSAFLESPSCQVLVANPQAGGVGLKFGHICATVIFFEPVGSPGIFDQALSRVVLEGQKKAVTCYIMKIVNTISPKAIDRMVDRNAQIKQANQDVKSLLDELCV